MTMVIVTVRDSKSDAFMRPFMQQSIGAAIRSFSDEVMRQAEDNMLYNHPEDFALYQVGWFDDQDGKVEGMHQPKLLIQADQIRVVPDAVLKKN